MYQQMAQQQEFMRRQKELDEMARRQEMMDRQKLMDKQAHAEAEARAAVARAAEGSAAGGWTCPQCGTVNQGKFCPGCGARKPEPKAGGRCLDLPVRTDGQYRKILHELRKDKTGTEERKGLGLPRLRRSESGKILHGMRQSEACRSSALQV